MSRSSSQIVRVPQMAVQPSVIPNILSNTITVRATAPVTAIIEQVIAANDKPAAEIIIDVEILEVNRERARRYGLSLTDYALGGVLSPELAPPNDAISPSSVGSPPPFNLNTISQGVSTADFYLGVPAAIVRFLETDSETKLVAKPQLRGQEGQTMTLNLGEDIPVPQTAFTALAAGGATVNPLTSFSYRPVGVIVEMTPRVTYENEIILDLTVENSTLGANIDVAGTSLPTFGSRKVVTRLRLRDGEPNLLAGLLREEDRTTLRGIPGTLGVPLLRSLFGDTDEGIRTTDIVMLLTPRIVRTHELTQRDVSPIHIGTQTNFGLTETPPLIAPRPDAGVPDAGGADPPALPAPDADPPDADLAPPAPDEDQLDPPPAEPIARALTPPAPIEPKPAVLPPSAPPEVPPGSPDVSTVTQVLVTPPGTQFRLGAGPYTMPISLNGASKLTSISLWVLFDPNVLQVRMVQEGSFLRQGGAQVTFAQQIDAAAGRIEITATRLNDATGAAGAGLLAAVLFDTVGVGSATVSSSGTAMTPGGVPIALEFNQASVTVQ